VGKFFAAVRKNFRNPGDFSGRNVGSVTAVVKPTQTANFKQ
jgi:hypothetical protein